MERLLDFVNRLQLDEINRVGGEDTHVEHQTNQRGKVNDNDNSHDGNEEDGEEQYDDTFLVQLVNAGITDNMMQTLKSYDARRRVMTINEIISRYTRLEFSAFEIIKHIQCQLRRMIPDLRAFCWCKRTKRNMEGWFVNKEFLTVLGDILVRIK